MKIQLYFAKKKSMIIFQMYISRILCSISGLESSLSEKQLDQYCIHTTLLCHLYFSMFCLLFQNSKRNENSRFFFHKILLFNTLIYRRVLLYFLFLNTITLQFQRKIIIIICANRGVTRKRNMDKRNHYEHHLWKNLT